MILGTSLGTYVRSGVNLYDAFEHVKSCGISLVDFPGFRTFMPQHYPVREQLRLAKRLEQLNMRAYCNIYLPEANPGSKNPEIRDAALKEIIPSAHFIHNMGGKAICYCEASGRPDYHEDLSKEEAFLNSVETTKRFCEYCYEKLDGLRVLLEIVPYGGNLASVEDMVRYAELVNAPNLYINADIGHFNLQKINPKRLEKAGERVISVHISDDDNHGDEGKIREGDCLIGAGTTDFKGYFDQLVKMDVDANARKAGLEECPCIIEAYDYNNGAPDADWVLMRAVDYILAHLPYFEDSVFIDS